MPVSATTPRSCSQSVHAGPRASRISTARRVRLARLRPLVGDAVVADHRRREADELLREARIGHGFLVARHAGREDRLAAREALGADRVAAEDRAVLQREKALHVDRSAVSPRAARRPSRRRRSSARRDPVSVSPSSQEFDGARPECVLAHAPLGVEVEQDEVRRRADRDARPVDPEDACRPGRHAVDERSQRQEAGQHELACRARRTRSRAR